MASISSLVIENPVDDQGHPGRLALIGTQCHPFALLGVCSVVMTSPRDLGGTFDTHDVRTGLVLGGSQGGEYPQQPSPPNKGKTLGVRSQAGRYLALIHPMVHAETPAVALAHRVTAERLADLTTSHHPISLPWGGHRAPSAKPVTVDGGEF